MKLLQNVVGAVRESPPPVRAFLAASVFMGSGTAIVEVLLNLYLQEQGYQKTEIGGMLSQRAIGTVLGSLAAGTPFLTRRPRATFAGAAALLCISILVITIAPDYNIRAAAATLFGFSLTFRLVGAAPFMFRHAREKWLATLLGLDAAIVAGTQVAGSGLSALLLAGMKSFGASDHASFQAALFLASGLVAVAMVIFFRARGGLEEELRTPASGEAQPPPGLLLYLKMCIPFFFVGAGAGLTIPYLNLYFEDRFQAPPSHISIYFAAVALATTAGYLASPWLAMRLGLVRSVVFSEVASIPFFLILAWSTSLPLSIAAFLLRGALMNLPYPLYGNLIMRLVGAEYRERANAITKLAWNLSWVVTARVAGGLLDSGGGDYVPVMLTTAVLYVLASSSFWIFFRKTGL